MMKIFFFYFRRRTPLSSLPINSNNVPCAMSNGIVRGERDDTMASQEKKCCSACGLLPRTKADGTSAPLKRCSRCKNAFYHDSECQRRHFPNHKHACRKFRKLEEEAAKITTATAIATFKPRNARPAALQVLIENREGRGNCLFAGSAISVGQRVEPQSTSTNENHNSNSNDTPAFWSPLVPPVLHEAQRSTCCAYCFRNLSTSAMSLCRLDEVSKVRQYQVFFCSGACRDAGRRNGFLQEEKAVGQLYSRGPQGPPHIFSTAILLYRILLALDRENRLLLYSKPSSSSSSVTSLRQQLDKMQSAGLDELLMANPASTNYEEKEQRTANLHHTQAVVATAVAMVQASTGSTHISLLNNFSMEYLMDLVTKIKINGFSISNGESVALGVGVFPTIPSSINHSCNPNLLQTFLYGVENQVPTLILTACQEIELHKEICISYTDHSSPRTMRRPQLQRDYYFLCNCLSCQDDEHETRTVGLRCHSCHAGVGKVQVPPESIETSTCPLQIYQCSNCGSQSFQPQVQLLNQFTDSLAVSNTHGAISVAELETEYQAIKEICYIYSWYVQESGERLVQALLERLSLDISNPAPAARALSVLDELTMGAANWNSSKTKVASIADSRGFFPTDFTMVTNNVLRRSILAYKAAKLRLFLSPDPRQAIEELHRVEECLSAYYPENHELMTGLRDCLSQRM